MNAAVSNIAYTAPHQPDPHTCVAIIWARDTKTEEQQAELIQALQDHPGVQSAVFSVHRPTLMVVRFQPDKTRGSDLVSVINRVGASARLVGC